MADTKISNLTDGVSINDADYIMTARSGGNRKLSLTGISASSVSNNAGKLVRYHPSNGWINAPAAQITEIYATSLISIDEGGTLAITDDNGYTSTIGPKIPGTLTANRSIYTPDKNGYISVADATKDSIQHARYEYTYNTYLYNSGNLALASDYNGMIIVSTNTTGITYTVASGLPTGYACSIIQYGTGTVAITGAPGISVNSYGGLTSIAGQYGSAYVNWVQNNSYLLAGNLA